MGKSIGMTDVQRDAVKDSIKHWEEIVEYIKRYNPRMVILQDGKLYYILKDEVPTIVPCYGNDCPLCRIVRDEYGYTNCDACVLCQYWEENSCSSHDSAWDRFFSNPNFDTAADMLAELRNLLADSKFRKVDWDSVEEIEPILITPENQKHFVEVRRGYEYASKALWLNEEFIWKISTDSHEVTIAIPIRRIASWEYKILGNSTTEGKLPIMPDNKWLKHFFGMIQAEFPDYKEKGEKIQMIKMLRQLVADSTENKCYMGLKDAKEAIEDYFDF